jgi:hypothetical protein
MVGTRAVSRRMDQERDSVTANRIISFDMISKSCSIVREVIRFGKTR